MRTKLKAAIGSLLISGVLAGAAVMPSAASAHGNTGPLCYGNENPYGWLVSAPNAGAVAYFYYNEAFRIKETIVVAGEFWSLGHSASSYPTDYWVYTPSLRCF
ncbi:MAG: hypothetical protein WC558_00650 [Patulibacter sp.]